MNIQIANRLVEMRKVRGLSQEALAEELGISRQAVSKWERAESSPDTSNLITLAKLYNVSLDELLNTDQEKFESGEPFDEQKKVHNKDETESNEQTNDYVRIGASGIHVKDGGDEVHIGWNGIHVSEDGKEVVSIGTRGIVIDGEDYSRQWKSDGLITLIIIAAYLFLGIAYSLWHPGWLIFLLIPISTTFITAVRKKDAAVFSFPVLAVLGVLTAIIIYGTPWTTVFALITIPIYYEVVKMFKGQKSNIKVNANMEKGFNVEFGATEDENEKEG